MNSKIKTHTATQLDQSYRLMQPGSNCYLPHRSETVLHPSPLFHQCRTWSECEFERSEVSSWAPYSLIRVIDHWPRWLLPPYYLLSSPNVLLTVPSLKPTPAGKNVQCRQRRMDNNRAASHFHWFFFFFFLSCFWFHLMCHVILIAECVEAFVCMCYLCSLTYQCRNMSMGMPIRLLWRSKYGAGAILGTWMAFMWSANISHWSVFLSGSIHFQCLFFLLLKVFVLVFF